MKRRNRTLVISLGRLDNGLLQVHKTEIVAKTIKEAQEYLN